MLKRNISSGRKRFRRVRRECGASLVELMVAIMISGIIMVALGSSLSEQMRLGTKTQNQLIAAELARVMVERIRSTPYEKLPSDNITRAIRIASGDMTDTNVYDMSNPIVSRPLQIDATAFQYRSPNASNPMPISKFPGQVTVSFGGAADGPFGQVQQTKTANVLVSWNEAGQSSPKQIELKVTVCKHGIQADR